MGQVYVYLISVTSVFHPVISVGGGSDIRLLSQL